MTFLLIFLNVNPSFTETQDKQEVVKVEIPIEAEIVRSFKIERDEISVPKEGRQVDKEMNVTVSERIDKENNTHTFIFE